MIEVLWSWQMPCNMQCQTQAGSMAVTTSVGCWMLAWSRALLNAKKLPVTHHKWLVAVGRCLSTDNESSTHTNRQPLASPLWHSVGLCNWHLWCVRRLEYMGHVQTLWRSSLDSSADNLCWSHVALYKAQVCGLWLVDISVISFGCSFVMWAVGRVLSFVLCTFQWMSELSWEDVVHLPVNEWAKLGGRCAPCREWVSQAGRTLCILQRMSEPSWENVVHLVVNEWAKLGECCAHCSEWVS